MKKLLVALVFTFVFCFGGLVFAQNTNGSTTTMENSNRGMMGRHRRRHHRRHARRHGRHMKRATGNGNANM